MNEVKQIVIGDVTKSIINSIFDNRIIQEDLNNDQNHLSRAIRIKQLKIEIMNFLKRNPNSVVEINANEYLLNKKVKVICNNFNEDFEMSDEEDICRYVIDIEDNYVEARVTKKVKIGRDIVSIIKSV